jgi:photosystem II stability/assembly factor-like uncharacterized protein
MCGADTARHIVFRLEYESVRSSASVFVLALALSATASAQTRVAYECTPEDVEAFGLTCSEDEPCAVFLELSSAEAAGGRVFVTGNLHTKDSTLFSLLLMSEDNGVSWTEPLSRIKSAALEQIQFVDLQKGWISGESLDPLSRNPFLLLTDDGGRSWRKKLLFEDTKFGVVSQFYFESRNNGELIVDASQGRTIRQESYVTMTGGESWEARQVSNTPLKLKTSRPASEATMRVRADAASGTYSVERGGGKTWEAISSFPIHVTDCH